MEIQLIKKRTRTAQLDWAEHRSFITKRYMHDKISLKALISDMEQVHCFTASKAQYEAQFNKWALKKKSKGKDWIFVKHKIEARQRQGKESIVYFHKQPLSWKTIKKEVARNVPLSSKYSVTLPIETPAGFFISRPGSMFLRGIRVDNLAYYQTQDLIQQSGEIELFNFDHLLLSLIWNGENSPSLPSFGVGVSDPSWDNIDMPSPGELSLLAYTNLLFTLLDFSNQMEVLCSRYNPFSITFYHQLEIDIPGFEHPRDSSGNDSILRQDDSSSFLRLAICLISNNLLGKAQSKTAIAWIFRRTPHYIKHLLKFKRSKSIEACIWAMLETSLENADSTILQTFSNYAIDIEPFLRVLGFKLLRGAVRRSNFDIARLLLHLGVNPLYCSPRCPEYNDYCISFGRFDMLKFILEAGVPTHHIISHWHGHQSDHYVPLHQAIDCGDIQAVQLLLELGAEVNKAFYAMEECHGLTALAFVVAIGDLDMAEVLLSAGAEINTPSIFLPSNICTQHLPLKDLRSLIRVENYFSATPLQAAAKLGNMEMVQLLLDWKADPNAPPAGAHGKTALQSAYERRDQAMFHYLVQKGALIDLMESGTYEKWGLRKAVSRQDIAEVRRFRGIEMNLHEPFDDNGKTLLEEAIETRNTSLVRELMDLGIGVNDRDNFQPPLEFALSQLINGHATSTESEQFGSFAMISTLLDAGADPNTLTFLYHSNPLEQMVSDNSVHWTKYEVIRLLIHHGAIVYEHQLCQAICRRDSKLVKLLFEYGADVNDISPTSGYPLVEAVRVQDFDCVEYLLDKGAEINLKPGILTIPAEFKNEETAMKMIDILLRAGADINGYSFYSVRFGTALQSAASNPIGSMKVIERLIQEGADVDAPAVGFWGYTALQGSAMRGHIKFALLFLEMGVDVNAPGAEGKLGRTALEGAAENGRLDMVQLLINAGADTHLPGSQRYRSAARYASIEGHLAVANLLESYFEGNDNCTKSQPLFTPYQEDPLEIISH